MTTTETKAKRKVRRNYQAQIADVIVYCKVNIEILEAMMIQQASETVPQTANKIEAFRAVLRRLGVE